MNFELTFDNQCDLWISCRRFLEGNLIPNMLTKYYHKTFSNQIMLQMETFCTETCFVTNQVWNTSRKVGFGEGKVDRLVYQYFRSFLISQCQQVREGIQYHSLRGKVKILKWPRNILAPCVSSHSHVQANFPDICSLTLEKNCTNVPNATKFSADQIFWESTFVDSQWRKASHICSECNESS